jgi:cell wall-associated NlpC family hydrolase
MKSKKRINLPLKDPSFYKWERIGTKKFLNQADTGDLLLFSTSSIGSGVQRILTRSDYDHVAMILRYSDSRIMFFEATSNEVNM